jgi:hypothetical protein
VGRISFERGEPGEASAGAPGRPLRSDEAGMGSSIDTDSCECVVSRWCWYERAMRLALRNSANEMSDSRSRGPSDSPMSRRFLRRVSALRPRRASRPSSDACEMGGGSSPTEVRSAGAPDGGAIAPGGLLGGGWPGCWLAHTGRGTHWMAWAASQASMKVRRRSLRKANQRSRSELWFIKTSLKRRNAPLPSMLAASFARRSGSSTMGM